MTVATTLSVIALLLSVWALYWRRRGAMAAERSASEAAKSATAARASADAATRSAAAAERSAETAAEALSFSKERAAEDAERHRKDRLIRLVQEGTQAWDSRGQLYWIVNREPELTEDEIRDLVLGVFAALRRSKAESEEHLKHVLVEREKYLREA